MNKNIHIILLFLSLTTFLQTMDYYEPEQEIPTKTAEQISLERAKKIIKEENTNKLNFPKKMFPPLNYDDGFKKEGNGVCHFDKGDVLLRRIFDIINNKIIDVINMCISE